MSFIDVFFFTTMQQNIHNLFSQPFIQEAFIKDLVFLSVFLLLFSLRIHKPSKSRLQNQMIICSSSFYLQLCL